WMKTEHFVGEVYTGLVKNRVLHDPAFFSDFGHLWTSYTIFDTITTSGTDTIGVQLGSALGDFCICDVEYDQIELTIIDSLTTPITVPFQQHDILVSPNPFMDRITIQSAEGNEFTIFIFSSDGNLISSNKSYSDFTLLDLSSFSSGIYFYQLHWRDKNKFPVQGKLIKM
ncbi:MAG: T9SS type A sorting domain-containing protein, partial [Saprospiraceae bacterium]